MPTGITDMYVHHVPGRLRVRSHRVKKNEQQALSATAWLRSLPGVSSAHANTVTGSLTLHYDPSLTGGGTLLAALKEAGYVNPMLQDGFAGSTAKPPMSGLHRELGARVAKTIAVYAVEEAVKALLVALL